MIKNLFNSPDKRRRQALAQASSEVMQAYLSTPFPPLNTRWDEVDIVSLDFETSGLDPATEQILSYGRVTIEHGRIRLGTAKHVLVRKHKPLSEESVIIHQITDDQSDTGRPLEKALPNLLKALSGKVLLVHFNRIEQSFLDAVCQRLYGSPFLIPTIDTLVLAERVLGRRNQVIAPNQLRLFNLREDFHLPKYKAHNALCDALTTAELFLAMEAEITPKGSTRLKELVI